MTAARHDAGDEPNPYADTAMKYRRAGWGGPLPLPYAQKEKVPVDTNKRTSRYPTLEKINEWRNRPAPQNICVRCAGVDEEHEIIGIDVDHYAKGNREKAGFDQLQKLIGALGPLPDTWTATARTDGKSGIRFFRVRRGLDFRGKVADDIEVIRKGHRYAVVWPSIHPDGGMYWWYPPGTDPTEENASAWDGEIPDPRTFEKLPQPWIDYLTSGKLATHRITDDQSSVSEIEDWATDTFHGDDDTAPCALMRQKLDAAIKKVRASSSFHDLLTNAHWNILHLAFEGHHGWNEAINEYEAAYFDALVARGGGSTDRTVQATYEEIFRSRVEALRKIKAKSDERLKIGAAPVDASCEMTGCAGHASNVIEFPNLEINRSSSDYDDDVARELHRLEVRAEAKRRFDTNSLAPLGRSATNLTAFLAQPANPTPMRIDRVMPDGGRVVFSAPYKAGKTTAVGNLIRALVDGDPFLGAFTVNKPARRLVLIDNELSSDMVRDWLLKQGIRNTDAVADVICLRGEISTFDILNDTRRGEWAKYLREIGCDYLIFDCLRPALDVLGLDENHDAGRFLTAFDELLSEAKTPGDATVVHHMGHTGERSRGDSRIQDWPDAIWKLVRENPDDEFSPRYFSATGRDVEVSQGLLKYNATTRHLTYQDVNRVAARKQRKADAAHVEVLRLLIQDKHDGGNGLSQHKLETEAMKNPDVTRKAAREALEIGVVTGEFAVWDGPRGAKMFTAATVAENGDQPDLAATMARSNTVLTSINTVTSPTSPDLAANHAPRPRQSPSL